MATLDEKITRVENNVAASLEAAAEMGAEVPEGANSNNLPGLIRSIPKGGASSWNDLTDRPFGEETVVLGDTLTWDGNTEGLVSVGNGFLTVHKVSDATPGIEDLANGAFYCMTTPGGNPETTELTADNVYSLVDGLIAAGDYCLVVHENAVGVELEDIGGLSFPEPGTYFMASGPYYVSSLTVPGYTFTKTKIKTIEPKFLPKSLQFGVTTEELGDTLTWDGNSDGLVSSMDVFYKVSDETPSISDFSNGAVFYVEAGEESERVEVPSDEIVDLADGALIIGQDGAIFVIHETATNVDIDGFIFNEPGVYFMGHGGVAYVSYLTIPGYNFINTKIQTIDPACLPKPLRFGEIATGGDTLTWDGNTSGLRVFDNLYKVCGTSFSAQDAAEGITITLSVPDSTMSDMVTIPASDIKEIVADVYYCYRDEKVHVMSVGPASALGFPEGVYLGVFQDPEEGFNYYVSSVTIPGYTGFPSIKPLDKKYLPGDLIPAYTAADEGKVLKIVGGVPTWVSIPSAEEASF